MLKLMIVVSDSRSPLLSGPPLDATESGDKEESAKKRD